MRTRLAVLTLLIAIAATSLVTADERDSYVWKRNASTTTMFHGDLDDVRRLTSLYGSEYVWTRQSGREYVITDRAVLDEVATIFVELDRAQAPMDAVQERMRPHQRAMDRAADRMEALAERLEDEDLSDSVRATIERQMHEVEKEMERVEAQMEIVEHEIERLSTVIEAKAEKVERKFEALVDRAIREGKAKRVN
jgi:peptidoglycan hydrolase CwlO-like protein